jgi:uncharacterized membrane protein
VDFDEAMRWIVRAFEVLGVAVLAIGSVWGIAGYLIALARGERRSAYEDLRHTIGRAILLGLEILIIADIVKTVTIDPSLESALSLGLIVVVRTFLSFSLEIELDGVVPWRRGAKGSEDSA